MKSLFSCPKINQRQLVLVGFWSWLADWRKSPRFGGKWERLCSTFLRDISGKQRAASNHRLIVQCQTPRNIYIYRSYIQNIFISHNGAAATSEAAADALGDRLVWF